MSGYFRFAVVAALGVCASFAVLAQDRVTLFHERGAPTATLLVVASGHFANPGRDNVNIKVDDVLAPRRQAEIAELVKRLAAFRPTIVAVEVPMAGQAKLDALYRDYRAGKYELARREHEQLGFRLAAQMKLARVHGVDWNGVPPGAESDYAWDVYGKAHGQGARVAALSDPKRIPAPKLGDLSLVEWLRQLNTPDAQRKLQQIYLDIAMIGDTNKQPGAAWVGTWYARNLRIFGNILGLVKKPHERVLVIYGASHAYPLRQMALESGAFRIEDASQYLK
jgi:hypothetical protein